MTDKPKWTDLFGIDPNYLEGVPEEPKYTESELRVLTEAALRLGRKEAGEEIAVSIETFLADPHGEDEDCKECSLLRQLARIARKISSHASPDATSGRTDPGMDSDLPQEPRAVRDSPYTSNS